MRSAGGADDHPSDNLGKSFVVIRVKELRGTVAYFNEAFCLCENDRASGSEGFQNW